MKFLVAAAAFLASYPEDLRTIEISDVVIRDNNGIYAIRFSLPTIHEEVFAAGHDLDAKRLPVPHFNYTWHATGTKKRFMLTLYNSNKTDARRGSARIPVRCQPGGNARDDFLCLQVGKISIEV